MLTRSAASSDISKRSKTQTLSRVIPNRPGGTIDFAGTLMSFRGNAEIYGEGEPVDYFCKVLSGAVRTCKLRIDGRRQIGGFYLPGDMLGVQIGEEHTFSAEAITDCQVLLINRRRVAARAAREAVVARELWRLIGHELERAQDHILLLIKSAEERVASFLLEMAGPVSEGNTINLPMTRQEIGEYLGLAIETVSRMLVHLEATAAIEVHYGTRQIVLLNRSALRQLNA
jgi:CRP/FNR family transcriptional regulator, nitrogen fixation regulation protein